MPARQREVVLHLRDLPPAQQEQFMAENPQFQGLPFARQQLVRKRIERWNAMTPEQKDGVRQRDEVVRLRAMPPEQQERSMANDPRFLQLPPARQQGIRRNLEAWNAMSPEQQDVVREREQVFQGLSPAQRQEARSVAPQYLKLAPDRRKAVLEAFRQLRSLPPAQRQDFLAKPEVRERFSPQEQHVLEGLSRLLPNSRSEASAPHQPQAVPD